jgi:putative heme-binding domain-containing protein
MLRERVLQCAEDSAIRVRFQTAFTLGETKDPKSLDALAKLARRDGDNSWIRAAILSSVSGRAMDLLRIVWRDEAASPGSTPGILLRELASLVAAGRKNDEITAALQTIASSSVPEAARLHSARNDVLIGLGSGLKRSGKSLLDMAASDNSPVRELALGLMAQAQARAKDEAAPLAQRIQAIDLLAFGRFEEAHATLASLLTPAQPAAVQLAAARALASFPQPEVGRILLDAYRGLTPNVRSEAVQALLARASRLSELLEAVESGLVPAADIPAVRRGALMRHADMAVRERALAIFAREAPAPRAEALKTYQAALRMPFHAQRGRKVFERECQACHRLDGQGHDVGPNLETIRNRTPDEMLVAVLDPNREVSPNFLEYVAVLADGRIATGVIASDSGASVTLRRPQGVEETVLRRDIEELAGSGKSLMPEGLEQRISPQDMADLLGYLLRREMDEK